MLIYMLCPHEVVSVLRYDLSGEMAPINQPIFLLVSLLNL